MTLRIFISYRSADKEGQYLAHMIFRELRVRYGEDSAFLDVDSRSPGLSFPKKVQSALDRSNAVLVVMGPEWLSLLKHRAKDERDWVRYEVSESLRRPALPVVPVSHVNARFPTASELPPEIRDLAFRDGVSLDPFRDFDSHLVRLLQGLERIVNEQQQPKRAEAGAKPLAGTDRQKFEQLGRFDVQWDDNPTKPPPVPTRAAAPMPSTDRSSRRMNVDEAEERYVGHAAALHDHGLNPLLALSNRVLLLVPLLARTARMTDVSALRARMVRGLRAFEDAAKDRGIPPERIMATRYVLCTALDEAASSTPWGGSGVWSRQSLLVEFHNEAWGGEKVFQLMSRLAEAPAANVDLLEMIYAVLTLGFEGRYRIMEDGAAQLATIHRKLGQLIAAHRGGIRVDLGQPRNPANSTLYAQ